MNFYFEAVKVLDKLDTRQGSIKGLIATVPEKDRKRTAALVIETLKYKAVLSDVIELAGLMKEERKLTSKNLALVLVHDLLLANGIQASDGVLKQAVLRHKARLHSELQRIKIKKGVSSTSDLAQVEDERAGKIPRYVRVNTHLWTMKDAIEEFISRGYTLSDPFTSRKGFVDDPHIPNLLQFSPGTQLSSDPLFHAGKLILQDKASCFPAHVLAPPAEDGAVVIDATAAPGNKTSHLSALMQNKGKLFAFERDRKRFGTLQTMLSRARCKNVEAVNADFLTTSPGDERFSSVTHILLDPSCSGSGIVNRLDHLLAENEKGEDMEERLIKLAGFQLLMIKHAMKFPSVRRIVYSTCSIHVAENEHVVREVLKSKECQAGQFTLAPKDWVLPTWPRRGLSGEMDNPEDAESLIRCSPGEDATNGFFVSMFVREDDVTQKKSEPHRKRKQDEEDSERDTVEPKTKRKKKKRRRLQSAQADKPEL